MRHFIVSTRRVLLVSGVIVRTVTLLPLRRITDLTWKETFLGQILGYGTFRFESAGQQHALSEITFLPERGDPLPAGQRPAVQQRLGRRRLAAGTTRATSIRRRRPALDSRDATPSRSPVFLRSRREPHHPAAPDGCPSAR